TEKRERQPPDVSKDGNPARRCGDGGEGPHDKRRPDAEQDAGRGQDSLRRDHAGSSLAAALRESTPLALTGHVDRLGVELLPSTASAGPGPPTAPGSGCGSARPLRRRPERGGS